MTYLPIDPDAKPVGPYDYIDHIYPIPFPSTATEKSESPSPYSDCARLITDEPPAIGALAGVAFGMIISALLTAIVLILGAFGGHV